MSKVIEIAKNELAILVDRKRRQEADIERYRTQFLESKKEVEETEKEIVALETDLAKLEK